MNNLSIKDLETLAHKLIPLVREAGQVLASLYKTELRIVEKSDGSPVTDADQASHNILEAGLLDIAPEIQVISEEGDIFEPRGNTFWLVDPLDGTKGFIRHTGDFCISIGLIHYGRPVLGCIHAPITGVTCIGFGGSHGFWIDGLGEKHHLRRKEIPKEGYRVLVGYFSRKDDRQKHFISQFNILSIRQMGSALKFIELAKGDADLFPRLIESYEWDTAAGQAIVEACGGHMLNLDKTPLTYGKPGLLNSSFIAICDDNFDWS